MTRDLLVTAYLFFIACGAVVVAYYLVLLTIAAIHAWRESVRLGHLTSIAPVLDHIANTCTPEWADHIDTIITANCAKHGHYYATPDRCTACGTPRQDTPA